MNGNDWRPLLQQRPGSFSSSPLTATPASFGVILVCALAFLAGFQPLGLALWPFESGHFQPWQVVSYAFLHGSFNHLFFNMFAVWMFGSPLEQSWGSRRFLTYYGACVVGAAVIQLLVQLFEGGDDPTVGASGGVFGLLLAYGVPVDGQTDAGLSALMLAAKQGCMECVTLLLRMGADPGLRGKNGQTALEMALSVGNTDIGELLEQAEAKGILKLEHDQKSGGFIIKGSLSS